MEPKTKRAIRKACTGVFWGVTGPILAFCLFMFFALTFVGVENICWWYPLIETHFTPDYSDEKFARIQPGMTGDEVTAILGEPRVIIRNTNLEGQHVDEVWTYSHEGPTRLLANADFAWLLVGVIFDPKTGRVVRTTKTWIYD